MRLSIQIIILLCSVMRAFAASISPIATSYHPVFKTCVLNDEDQVTQIREFQNVDTHYALVVHNQTLETTVVKFDELKNCVTKTQSDSNYSRALKSFTNVSQLQDAGVTHELNKNRHIYLTVDLCPSHKPMDLKLFEQIQGGVKPVPVAVSISGLWLNNHSADLGKLLRLQDEGEIKITWVNHTYSHPYNPKLPLNHNFILQGNVNLQDEVFKNEILLLSNGITPSIFFRFPGLVSDEEDVEQLSSWGLISLGADAWLALGQKPVVGSFILVHANGNEPHGLDLLYDDLKKNPEMRNQFSDIYQAFER